MWISTIELTQFKSYSHAEFSFPQPEGGKNIAVIGGLNGYGKTSILEALYLCLYGKDALPHLARAGLKVDDYRGYPTFLERALNGEARREGADMMSVRVVLHRTKTKAVEIRRRWFFRTKGQWHDEETVVRELNREIPGSPRTDGKNGFYLSELLEQQFIPAHIAPFFFFDGEEVKKLADQSRIEQIKQGLEGLLGVVLLRSLADRLKGFEANRRQNIANVDESGIDRMLTELTSDEAKLKELRDGFSLIQEKLDAEKSERTSLIERITAAGGGGGAVASVADLVEERTQLGMELRTTQVKLEKILGEKLPFQLMPENVVSEFRSQLSKEVALEQWETECRALQPKREQFASAFLDAREPDISPPLNSEQLAAIRARIETAWASLFHPPPENCAEVVRHSYLNAELRRKTFDFLDTIAVGQQEVNELLEMQRQFQTRIDELRRRITRLEGVDRDGTLSELTNNLNKVTALIDELDSRLRDDARQIAALEVTVNQRRASYEHERKRADATSPIRQLVEKSEKVRKVIEELVPSLFPLKVKQLSQAMTRVYKQLAHKTQVEKIVIENDGTTRVLSSNGKELTFDRSAGENQIFATALIAGLAEVSKVPAPLVVDTPLGRLDSKHRENIFRFWTSDPNRQVILLSQDEEINSEFYKRVKKNVAVTYLLEHTDVGDGIGRTAARKGKYFGAV
ncbi:MAG: DNA sulfur modification protein DndD, partial [Betaproteobacteria bacterium]